MTTWNPRIPLNWRTGVFCFLMGAVFSAPIGMFPTKYFLFEPPESLVRLYPVLVVMSFVLLPLWCVLAVRQYPPLPALGTVTFVVGTIAGLLFPAVST